MYHVDRQAFALVRALLPRGRTGRVLGGARRPGVINPQALPQRAVQVGALEWIVQVGEGVEGTPHLSVVHMQCHHDAPHVAGYWTLCSAWMMPSVGRTVGDPAHVWTADCVLVDL